MSNSFAEVFRPVTPEQLFGESQRRLARQLFDKVEKGEVVHELLFTGNSGIGKTTIARMYCRKILGLGAKDSLDNYITEMNCSRHTGIDDVRSIIIDNIAYLPMQGNYKIYFLDEVHRLSKNAQDALLTEIEPVPNHVIVIASTTDPETLNSTFRSRFNRYDLSPLMLKDFQDLSRGICIKLIREGKIKEQIREAQRDQAIEIANGNVRDFVRYLNQIIDGTFNANSPDGAPIEIDLVKLITGGNKELSKWFGQLSVNTDYVRTSKGMAGYSASIIKNPSSNPNSVRLALEIVEIFGDELIDNQYLFNSKLASLYKRIYKNGS